MSSQPGEDGCRRARQVRSASVRRSLGDSLTGRAFSARERRGVEHGVGGDVVGAARVRVGGGEPVRLADVAPVHGLQHEPLGHRQDR
jgi:hypothetical protein